MNPLAWNRRTLLRNSSLATFTPLLQGCWFFHHNPQVLSTGLLSTPGIDPASSPLTIDAHCHIFNGSDLQVQEFIGRVVISEKGITQVIARALGKLLQKLVWDSAPSGAEEAALLSALRKLHPGADVPAHISAAQETQYQKARTAILATRPEMHLAPPPAPSTLQALGPVLQAFGPALQQEAAQLSPTLYPLLLPEPTVDDVLRQIYSSFDQLNYQAHLSYHTSNINRLSALLQGQIVTDAALSPAATTALTTPLSVLGVARYLSENFQYRIVQAQDYLDTFTPAARRDVDLMAAHLVDYDWPLAQGHHTPTSLQQQVLVMEQISLLTRGRIHAFVPYDPMREVACRAGHVHPGSPSFSSLSFIQQSVQQHGCIGVKLYPPMGFSASRNKERPNSFWAGNKLPLWMSRDVSYNDGKPPKSFGTRLDEALEELFAWCETNGVPVMAHSNQTNGVTPAFKQLAAAEYWKDVCTAHPNLHVSFGHLGDFSADTGNVEVPPAAEQFIQRFEPANHAFGDSAFDAEILRHKAGTLERFDKAFADHSPHNILLPQRMMYGTDWNLLMTVGDIASYMQSFQQLAETLPVAGSATGHSASDNFFGWNAAAFLGLAAGQKNRGRLEDFYRANGLDTRTNPPAWMTKVDHRS